MVLLSFQVSALWYLLSEASGITGSKTVRSCLNCSDPLHFSSTHLPPHGMLLGHLFTIILSLLDSNSTNAGTVPVTLYPQFS